MGDIAQREFPHLLATWGYAAIILAIVADSFGVPIPGEAMLLLAAVYAGATHHLALPLVIGAAASGAILGDNVTYVLGRRGGYPLLRRYGPALHLGQQRLRIGQYLFGRYGGAVVLVGRLMPALHVWTAVLAGVNRMPWIRFALANAAGAAVWATCLSLAGYAFGRAALHLGGVMTGLAIPLALVIAGLAVLLLRANGRRLYAEVQQASGAREEESNGVSADRGR